MRDYQQQVVDLQNVVIKGMREIRENQKGLRHLVLNGVEGKVMYDLCQLIAAGSGGVKYLEIATSMQFEGLPVIYQ